MKILMQFLGGNLSRYKTLVNWTSRNPSKFFSPFAAYIVPKDLKPGERVLINDVITNHVSGRWNQGDVSTDSQNLRPYGLVDILI